MQAHERKARPVYSGVLRYFPDAIAEVAHVSYTGNQQHNGGGPIRWDRSKSTDEADALMRHLLQAGDIDEDGIRHTAKVAWRALALLQRELEAAGVATVADTLGVVHGGQPDHADGAAAGRDRATDGRHSGTGPVRGWRPTDRASGV